MLKKIILGFLVVILVLIAALVAIPFIFKDEINAKIKEQINKELLADVDYSSYDLSIFKSFPDLYFSLNDLSVIGRDDFAGDTLAHVNEIGIGLELMKIIKGEELLINSILIDEAEILAYNMINENGDTIANYDILPETESEENTSSTSLIDINVNDFKIQNTTLYYSDIGTGFNVMAKNLNSDASITYIDEDATVDATIQLAAFNFIEENSGMTFSFEDLNTNAAVDYSAELAKVITNLQLNNINFNDGSIQLLNQANLNADLNITANLENNIFQLTENEIALNALKIYADGSIGLPDENTTTIDMEFNADKSSFKELLSIIPAEYLKDIDGATVNGNFAFNGYAKGNLTETTTPAFDVNLMIENGFIQYPDLPSAIENINLNANFNNTTSNIEATTISIPNASLSVINQDILFSLLAKNALGDPDVDFSVKGGLSLDKIPEFYPLEGVNTIAGALNADLSFKGLLSDVEQENFEKVDFNGSLNINELKYDAIDVPMAVDVDDIQFNFNPQNADLTISNATIGESDFNINGKVENIINYVLADGTIDGKLVIQSNYINLDELMGSETSTEETTTEETSTIVKVPENIKFNGSLAVQKINYDGLAITDVLGNIQMEDERVDLTNLSAKMLGGNATINGSYITKDVEQPIVNFKWDIQKFDIQKTFNQFNSVQAIAPMAKYLTGTFSTDMSISSVLNNDLSLDLTQLNGLGNIEIPYASIDNLPLFDKIADVTKISAIQNPEIKDAWTVLKIENGKVNVEPFQINMQDMVMDIEGSNGFDQSIDYLVKMTVPSDKFGGAATIANNFLSQQNIPLLNLSVPQNLTFNLNVGGTMTSPNVSIGKVTADGSESSVKDQVVDSAKEQIEEVKETVKEEAQEQLNNVKEQAQEQVEETKEEVKETIKEETENVKESIKENLKNKFPSFGK